MRTIRSIVEGDGEVEALPVLLRRLQAVAEAWNVKIEKPVKIPKGKILAKDDEHIKRILQRTRNEGCDGILMLLDSDGDCPVMIATRLRRIVTTEISDVPTQIVIAHQEYEAWFLAGIESLQGMRGIRPNAEPPQAPEAFKGAKERLEEQMESGSSYSETADQPAFSRQFSLDEAHRRSRSFRKLVKAFGDLMEAIGEPISNWPPPALTGGG